MKFPLTIIDKDKYFKRITALLNDEEAIIFIDTNILATFYKLNAEARRELLDWMKGFTNKDRLKTPTWALNEYIKRFVRKQTNDYLSAGNKLKTIKKEFKELRKFLSMHIDEENLKAAKYLDRAAYIADLENVTGTLDKLSNSLKNKTAAYIIEINEALQEVLSDTVIESDIFNLVEPVGNYGLHRYRAELPPGFEDGHKDFNSYGDLIIWQEILAYSKARNRKKVLILTNDQKPDWMYAPYQIVVNNRTMNNNEPELKIADPRLIYEFSLATYSEELYIINLETLTQLMIESGSKDLLTVARALQLEVKEEQDLSEPEIEKDKQVSETEPIETIAEKIVNETVEEQMATEVVVHEVPKLSLPTTYSTEALADALYGTFFEQRIGNIVEKLKSYSWYSQNPAIEEMVNFLNTVNVQVLVPDDLFVLGRNVYQSAVGGAYSAIDIIENKLISIKLPFKLKSHLVAGMFFEIYFNANGSFRGHNLKSYLVGDVFTFQTDPDYAESVNFIVSALQEHLHDLFLLPSINPKTVSVELIVEETETSWSGPMLSVSDLKIEGESVVQYSDNYYFHKPKQVSSAQNIKQQIESVFAIPVSQQNLKNNSDKDLPYLFQNKAILWRGKLPEGDAADKFDLDF